MRGRKTSSDAQEAKRRQSQLAAALSAQGVLISPSSIIPSTTIYCDLFEMPCQLSGPLQLRAKCGASSEHALSFSASCDDYARQTGPRIGAEACINIKTSTYSSYANLDGRSRFPAAEGDRMVVPASNCAACEVSNSSGELIARLTAITADILSYSWLPSPLD